MRKIALTVLIVFLTFSLFAVSSDRWSFLSENAQYSALYENFKNKTTDDKMLKAISDLEKNAKNTEQDKIMLVRGYTTFINYLMQYSESKDKELAKKYLEKSYNLLKELEGKADEYYVKTLKFLTYSVDYLVTKNISKGLACVKEIDSLFEENPDDIQTIILMAAKKMSAPAMGGGSIKEAEKLYTDLLEKKDLLNKADLFDLYYGLGFCNLKQKKWSEAKNYFLLAKEIYPDNKDLLIGIKGLK